GWGNLSAHQKQELGMWDTQSLEGRARACATCHVGAPGREVNHDLIAVGHPRLRFDFGAAHTRLPQHWDRRKDLQRYPDLEARAGAVGQVVSARAALELLVFQADDSVAKKNPPPWPEFAAYDCAACHH